MPLQANQQIIPGRGTNTTIVDDQSGRRASVFLPTFPEGTSLAKAAVTLTVALENFSGNVRVNASRFLPEVVPQNNRVAAMNVLRTPATNFKSIAIDEKQATAKATAVALSVVPATVATAPIRARAVKRFDDAADIAAKVKMLSEFTLEQLSGIVEVDALDVLPDGLAQVARDRFMIMAHIARTGLSANFARQSTATDPLGSGVDTEAVMAAAQEALDALKARSATVADAANVLRDTTFVVALACDLSTDQAFALLTGNQPPTDRP
jgi:hypothetical protein